MIDCKESAADERNADLLRSANALQRDDSKESGLDRTLAETFPCSDALSSIPNPVRDPPSFPE